MRNKKFRLSQRLSPSDTLARVKREIKNGKNYQKFQQNLIYLNNSFNNNIQCQQIFIDICKSKKKNIKSKQLKTMYNLFSQNKANLCIFDKIANQQLLRIKDLKMMSQTNQSKCFKDTRGVMQTIVEDQSQNQRNVRNARNSQSQIQSFSRQSLESNGFGITRRPLVRLSIDGADGEDLEEEKQFQLLVRRIYCRIIEKVLVKIAFYSMNSKYLDYIAPNILDLTRNLETIIRRLTSINDLRLLQQIIIKVYRQNLIIQSKTYQMLINGGYILSIDQFYRVNGLDIVHKDVFQRKTVLETTQTQLNDQIKQTLKDKILKIKGKKQRQVVVKKQHIDRTNNQINEKYLFCVAQMKSIIQKSEMIQQTEEHEQTQLKIEDNTTNAKKISMFSKTQSVVKSQFMQKPSRFSHIANNIEQDEIQSNIQNDLQLNSTSLEAQQTIQKNRLKKTSFQNANRLSIFSPQFSKLIKSQSPVKLQRNSAVLSQKLLQFNQFQKKQRKQSSTISQSEQFDDQREKKPIGKIVRSKNSQIFDTSAINKLLKIYQARNSARVDIDDFLGASLRLPNDVKQSLKQELLRLKYDSLTKRTSSKSPLKLHQRHEALNSQDLHNTETVAINHKYQDSQNNNSTRNSSELQTTNLMNHNINGKSPPSTSLTKQSVWEQQKRYKGNNITLRQTQCLVKLSRNRTSKLNRIQLISSSNNSIFTIHGVKNLLKKSVEGQIPHKKQKLRRMPCIKVNREFQENQKPKKDPSNQNQNKNQYPKLTKKAYHSQHSSLQNKCLTQTIGQVVTRTQHPKNTQRNHQGRNYLKQNNSLYKYNKALENRCFDENNTDENIFRTFQMDSYNNVTNKVYQKKECLKQRVRKINTCHIEGLSQICSPLIPQGKKQNTNMGIFEVYDVQRRKKIAK